MNIFRQLMIRKKVFSVLLIILIASSVTFSCIGCCAYFNAKNQIANISSSYTTLAVPVTADYYETVRLGIGQMPSDDGKIVAQGKGSAYYANIASVFVFFFGKSSAVQNACNARIKIICTVNIIGKNNADGILI